MCPSMAAEMLQPAYQGEFLVNEQQCWLVGEVSIARSAIAVKRLAEPGVDGDFLLAQPHYEREAAFGERFAFFVRTGFVWLRNGRLEPQPLNQFPESVQFRSDRLILLAEQLDSLEHFLVDFEHLPVLRLVRAEMLADLWLEGFPFCRQRFRPGDVFPGNHRRREECFKCFERGLDARRRSSVFRHYGIGLQGRHGDGLS